MQHQHGRGKLPPLTLYGSRGEARNDVQWRMGSGIGLSKPFTEEMKLVRSLLKFYG